MTDKEREQEWIRHLLYQILIEQGKAMAALEALQANVAKLSSDVDSLLTKSPTTIAEADVQAQADAVAAIDAKVAAKLS